MRKSAILTVLLGAAFLANAADDGQRRPGLLVRLYDIGVGAHALPELAPDQLPNVVKIVPTLDLVGRRGDFAPLEDRFVTEVSGFLEVGEAGEYTFRLVSDDGARLWIDDRLVIDHDGLHGPDPKGGAVELTTGEHTLLIRHFESGGGEQLTLMWRVPGTDEQAGFELIPANALAHDASASNKTAPGKKRIIPPLRRGRPGDGTPVAGTHPGYAFELLVTPMLGLQETDAVCKNLNIRTRPIIDGESSLILPPPDVWSAPEVSQAALIGGQHPYGPGAQPASEGKIDPCGVQYIVAGRLQTDLHRVQPDESGGFLQGCAFRFAAGLRHPITRLDSVLPSAFVVWFTSPDTPPAPDLLTLCFVRPKDRVVFEMRSVRAMSNGFEIEFSQALDPRVGWDPECYYVEQWPFEAKGTKARRHEGTKDTAQGAVAHGEERAAHAPRRDGVVYPVKSASVSADRRRVFLEIANLKESHVVYIRLLPPCLSEEGELPWSTEAWYTLNKIPADRAGTVLTPPPAEPQNFLTDAEKAAGWKLLFDGQTTAGWRGYKKSDFPAGWTVKDGCLVRIGPGGDICTVEQFDDFELELEWRICAGGNSGIFYRVSEAFGWPWESGPEMQVLDNAEHPDGRNPKTSAGSNYALYAPVRDVTEPVGFFNRAKIVVDGNHVEHWLNGVKVVEYELGSPEWERLVAESKFRTMPNYGRMRKGHIVLQDHGDKVWYRNIKIRARPSNGG